MMECVRESMVRPCCAVLILCVSALISSIAVVPLWEAIRRIYGLPRIQQIVVGICIVGLVEYGATKSRISFDGGIRQGEQPSLVTNDTVYVSWQRDTSGGVYVPDSAAVYIDCRPNTETNADWVLLAETTVGAWSWSGVLADATNYDYNVWAYYVPPQPVHTNGVWVYRTQRDRADVNPIPLRARIEVNGKAIATPAQSREDYE